MYRRNPLTPIQTKLDFGQKRFSDHRCTTCGMVYTPGDKTEDKLHRAYHNRICPEVVRLPRGKHQRVLSEYFDGTRVAEILLQDRQGLASFHQITNLMNRYLGCDSPSTNCEFIPSSFDTKVPDDWRVFAFVKDGNQQVVGCVVVQELTPKFVASKNYQLRPLVGGLSNLLTWHVNGKCPKETDEVPPSQTENATIPQSFIMCGVRRLWTDEKHRRKGVATRLLDCVLTNLIYGRPLSRSEVAFADLTADGANFAASFVGRETIYIY